VKGLVGFARRNLGLNLHPGQVEVLKAWELSGKRKAQELLGRRSGKDMMAGVAAICSFSQIASLSGSSGT